MDTTWIPFLKLMFGDLEEYQIAFNNSSEGIEAQENLF
jgi:hypothetical protein